MQEVDTDDEFKIFIQISTGISKQCLVAKELLLINFVTVY
jgi:hypothetical protein